MLLVRTLAASLFFGLSLSLTTVVCSSKDFDSVGTLFVFGFYDIQPRVSDPTAPHNPEIYISTLSNTPVTVVTSSPHLPNLNFTVTLSVARGRIGFVSVPNALRETIEGVRNSVIVIQSTGPISVKACIKEERNAEGLIIYPVDVLGYHYLSVNSPSYNSIIQVVAWNPGITQVTIRFSVACKTNGVNYAAGKNYTQNLQQYQLLFVYLSSSSQQSIDLTNSDITANQSVAAFSANMLSCLSSSCDHTWEQLMPVTSWGTKFALIGTPGRTAGDYFKITSVTPVTLTFTPALPGDPASVSPTSFGWVMQASGTYRMLEASAPIQVYLYAISQQSGETQGDPSATLIPPVNQYSAASEYSTFSGPNDPFTHYAAIVASTNKIGTIIWNDDTIANLYNTTWVDLPGTSGLSTTWFIIPAGVHDVYSIDPTAQFLIIMAGYAPFASYGTIAGSRWSIINALCYTTSTVSGDGIDNDCDKYVDEELLNGLDDDGDGMIDEDLAMTTRVDGQWSAWTNFSCNPYEGLVMRSRQCTNPPPSGQYALDCIGNSTEIDEAGSDLCNVTEIYITEFTVDYTDVSGTDLTTIPATTLPTTPQILFKTTSEARKNYLVYPSPSPDQQLGTTTTLAHTTIGPNMTIIIGAVVGGLLGLLCLCCIPLAVILARRRRKKKNQVSDSQVSLTSNSFENNVATSYSQLSLNPVNDPMVPVNIE